MQHLSRVGLLCSALLLTACTTPLHTPKLDEIYGPAARVDSVERNPVVVIPGVLGSRLRGPEGEAVWGAFGGGSASPRDPDGARLLALPMRPGASPAELRDGVSPDGALDRVRIRLFGLPFQQRAYADILGLLGAAGYVDPALSGGLAATDAEEPRPDVNAGGLNWGEDHYTCFQFAYDWRRDNAENAARLHAFLIERRREVQIERAKRLGGEPADHDVRFDVIAHSMGGLLARHMLRYGAEAPPADAEAAVPWSGASLVSKLVMIGTPNAGSAKVLTNLYEGAAFGPFLPAYSPQILGTMPALYQLIPRERHGALLDASGRRLDPLSPELWESRGWGLADPDQDKRLAVLLPEVRGAAARRRIALDHQAKLLRRASAFHAAMDRPASPPAGTEIFLVAGDAVSTASVMRLGEGGGLEALGYAPGDGTVTRASALLDERPAADRPDWTPRLQSPLTFAGVTFLHTDHLGLTRDPAFSDNVLWLLLERPSAAPSPSAR